MEQGVVAENCFGIGYNGCAVHMNMIEHYKSADSRAAVIEPVIRRHE